MIKQIDYEKWIDRIDNNLHLQTENGWDIVPERYTRHELIELRLMISYLYNTEMIEQIKEKVDGKE